MNITLSERFREARKAAGLTQGELAEKVGVTLGEISHIERGRRFPNRDTLLGLCKALKLDAGEVAKALILERPEPVTPQEKDLLRAFRNRDIGRMARIIQQAIPA